MKLKGKWYCPTCNKFHNKVILGVCPKCGNLCRYFRIQEKRQIKIQQEIRDVNRKKER